MKKQELYEEYLYNLRKIENQMQACVLLPGGIHKVMDGISVVVGFALVITINVLIKKQNVPVKYKDVSEYVERIEKRKKELAEKEAKLAAANAE